MSDNLNEQSKELCNAFDSMKVASDLIRHKAFDALIENKQYREINKQLEKKLKLAIKTLEYYGSKQMNFKPVSGIEYCNMDYCSDHGDKARQTLKQLEEMK